MTHVQLWNICSFCDIMNIVGVVSVLISMDFRHALGNSHLHLIDVQKIRE